MPTKRAFWLFWLWNTSFRLSLTYPYWPVSVTVGRRLPHATPTRAVAACRSSSAARTSGRRESRSDGSPSGTLKLATCCSQRQSARQGAGREADEDAQRVLLRGAEPGDGRQLDLGVLHLGLELQHVQLGHLSFPIPRAGQVRRGLPRREGALGHRELLVELQHREVPDSHGRREARARRRAGPPRARSTTPCRPRSCGGPAPRGRAPRRRPRWPRRSRR